MLENLGEAPEVITPTSSVKRFKINGKLNGWYTLHIDGRAAGACGDWKQGSNFTWKAQGDYPKLTDQQRIDFKIEAHRQQLIRKEEEKARHEKAAETASYILSQSTTAIDHPYIIKKRVKPHNTGVYNGSLVIPVFNSNTLVGVQLIDKDGGKRFLSGTYLKGSYSQLGKCKNNQPIIIAEGFATAASIYEATDYLTYVAFSAGNLKAVAQYVRSLHPTISIVIAGDNDLSGVGQKAAIDAALAVGGKYIIPPIVGTDWNDQINKAVS